MVGEHLRLVAHKGALRTARLSLKVGQKWPFKWTFEPTTTSKLSKLRIWRIITEAELSNSIWFGSILNSTKPVLTTLASETYLFYDSVSPSVY